MTNIPNVTSMNRKTNRGRITKVVDLPARTVTFTSTITTATRTLRLDELSQDLQTRHALHGVSQKFGDLGSMAGVDTEADYWDAFDALEAAQRAGSWNVSSGGERSPSTAYIAEALAALTKQPLPVVAAKLAAMSADERKKVSADPRVKREVLRLRLAAMSGDETDEPMDF